ncbi:hypothetical protein IWQ49_000060 [Labrenzia sp. EL_126]|nr:hypothetical protein [Labrenzia sp. EL_126]
MTETNILPKTETRLAALESEIAALKQRVAELEAWPGEFANELNRELSNLQVVNNDGVQEKAAPPVRVNVQPATESLRTALTSKLRPASNGA